MGADGFGNGDKFAGLAEPAGWHVGVDRLVFATANQECLVPDARAGALANPLHVVTPHVHLRVGEVVDDAG